MTQIACHSKDSAKFPAPDNPQTLADLAIVQDAYAKDRLRDWEDARKSVTELLAALYKLAVGR